MKEYIILLIVLLLLVLVYIRQSPVEGFEGPSKLEGQLTTLQKKNIDIKGSVSSQDEVLKEYIQEAQVNMKHQITHLLQNSIPEMFSNPTLGSIDSSKLNKVKELIETNEILEKSKGFIGALSMSMGLGGGGGMSGGFGKGSDTKKEKSDDKEGGGGMFGNMFG